MTDMRRNIILEEMPPEVARQGTAARRAWRRERMARIQAQQYDEQVSQIRAVDESRPLCKSIPVSFHIVLTDPRAKNVWPHYA